MSVSIRTKEKCRTCGGPFHYAPRLGFTCPLHGDQEPKKLYLYFRWQGKQYKIYSHHGRPLRNDDLTFDLASQISKEIKAKSLDLSKYIEREQEEYFCSNLLDRFQEKKLPTLAPSHQQHYRCMISRAREFFKQKDVRELRGRDIEDYRDNLIKLGISPKTLKNHLDNLRTFFFWCKDKQEMIPKIPAFPELSQPMPKARWIAQDEQIDLFSYVPEEDKPLIGFLVLHGIRPGEARAIKCGKVNLERRCITIDATFSGKVYREQRKGKRSEPFTIAIHEEMFPWIEQRVKSCLPSAWLFVNPVNGLHYSGSALGRVWNNVRANAKIDPQFRLYDFCRHSFVSNQLNMGTPLERVSRMVGHTDIRTTLNYAHSTVENFRTDLSKLTLKKRAEVVKIGEGRKENAEEGDRNAVPQLCPKPEFSK